MTLRELLSRKDAMGPALRRAMRVNCAVESRHDAGATPSQLRRLPILVGGPLLEWRYCERCWSVFGPDGRTIEPPVT